VLNSLAAIAVATELGVPDTAIQSALVSFQGIERRLQQHGDVETPAGRVTLIDDYGHHPTEIAATLEAIRQGWPGRRIVLVFQPHRYTRTRDLLDDFARVLAGVEALIVTEVYAAGEAAIAGADGKAICRAVRSHARVEPVFLDRVEGLPQVLLPLVRDGDLVVTMGAGSIGSIAPELPRALAKPPAGATP
jgi:UDP-N-acetylmuramate--alanine ligase